MYHNLVHFARHCTTTLYTLLDTVCQNLVHFARHCVPQPSCLYLLSLLYVFDVTFQFEIRAFCRAGPGHSMFFLSADTCLPLDWRAVHLPVLLTLGDTKCRAPIASFFIASSESTMKSERRGKDVQWKGLSPSLKHYPDIWGEKVYEIRKQVITNRTGIA